MVYEMSLVKAVLVDDEKHIRLMIRTLLETSDIEVIAEGSSGEEAIELATLHKPDALIIDVNMPYLNGDDSISEIKNVSPETCVIVIASVTDYATIEKCFTNGASNYIRKDTPVGEMKSLILETFKNEGKIE